MYSKLEFGAADDIHSRYLSAYATVRSGIAAEPGGGQAGASCDALQEHCCVLDKEQPTSGVGGTLVRTHEHVGLLQSLQVPEWTVMKLRALPS